tara:strand:+ start:301 stop:930 length:630 start_codon:yes stop_codon:yes gene_type:complete
MSGSYTGLTPDADGVLRIPPKGKGMEKFQNFLNNLYGNTRKFGGTALERLNQFGEYLAPSDPLKSKNTSVQQGLLTPPQFITQDGALGSFFSGGGVLTTEEGKKTALGERFEDENKEVENEEKNYLKENKELLQEIAGLGEQARNRDFMREGIRTLANAPLIGAQAQMAAAEGINRLTIGNMGAMAAQNRVLEANPTKQKIASLKYFRG